MSNGSGQAKSLPISLAQNLPHGLARQGGGSPPFQLSGSLPDGDQGTDYTGALGISGGIPPYSNPQVVAGTLPPEFSLLIIGNQLFVSAIAPITFSGLISISLTVDDAASATTPPYPVTFTINVVGFIVTEGGDFILTEDGSYLRTET